MNNSMAGLLPSVLFLSVALGLSSNSVHADTVMNITGNIKASPCTVNTPAGGISVALGNNIQAPTLNAAGMGSPWVGFPINVTGCPAATTAATMTLSGTPDTTQTSMFANTGTATNAQIQLQNVSDSRTLGNGATVIQPVDVSSHSATFNLQARAYTSQGGVMPGTLIGVVLATFTYQ